MFFLFNANLHKAHNIVISNKISSIEKQQEKILNVNRKTESSLPLCKNACMNDNDDDVEYLNSISLTYYISFN